jgi:hypothetical protein
MNVFIESLNETFRRVFQMQLAAGKIAGEPSVAHLRVGGTERTFFIVSSHEEQVIARLCRRGRDYRLIGRSARSPRAEQPAPRRRPQLLFFRTPSTPSL